MTGSTLNMHYTIADPKTFGISEYEPVLPIYHSDQPEDSKEHCSDLLHRLDRIDPDRLSPENAYTYRLLHRSLENDLALADFPYYNEPLSPSSGMQSQLPVLLAEYTFRTKRDVTDYLALLDQIDDYFASLLLYEQEKAAAGFFMPAPQKKSGSNVTPLSQPKNWHREPIFYRLLLKTACQSYRSRDFLHRRRLPL